MIWKTFSSLRPGVLGFRSFSLRGSFILGSFAAVVA